MNKFYHFSFFLCLLVGICLRNSVSAQVTQQWQYSNKLTTSFMEGITYKYMAYSDGTGYLFNATPANFSPRLGFRKVSSTGDSVFRKPEVCNSGEYGYLVNQTSDGGFLFVGKGTTSSKHMMFIKMAANANYQWRSDFGGSSPNESLSDAIQTSDGGYLAVGRTNSTDGDAAGTHGGQEGFCVKIGANGLTQWKKVFGGTSDDYLFSVMEETNGNFVLVGTTASIDGDLSNNYGGDDIWVLKISSTGNIIWSKTYGGTLDELASFIFKTADGSYLISGPTWSSNGDFIGGSGTALHPTTFLLKLSTSGNVLWTKADEWVKTPNTNPNSGYYEVTLRKTIDGFACINDARNPLDTPNLIKLDANGNILWYYPTPLAKKTMMPTTDGGFYFIEMANSGNPLTQTKLKDNTIGIEESSIGDAHLLKIYPNPSTGLIKIEVEENTGFIAVKVQDMLGREIINTSMPNGAELVLTDYPAGCYAVTIKSENGKVYTQKVIKD